MINKNSIEIVNCSKFNKNFIKPLYQSYCFSNINNLIEYSLDVNKKINFPLKIFDKIPHKYDKIILFLIDGFGWRFYEKFSEERALKFLTKYGVVNKLTSQFPSSTAAHITKVHTNLNVGESGIFEWYYYEPKVDAIISPLLFSFAGDNYRDSLKNLINPEKIFPKITFYQKLKKYKIKSYIFQHENYTPSTYSNIVFKGASVFSYKTLSEAIINLLNLAKKEDHKSYYFLYFDKIDSISHIYGPCSSQTTAEIQSFLSIIEKVFLPLLKDSKNTLFLLTADHGEVEIDPQKTFYLNQKAPKIKKWLMKNKKGEFLAPAGSPRDIFLYIKEENLKEAESYLEKKLKGIAEVYYVSDLIKEGFFGDKISKNFIQRVGNLLILPYKGKSVWWYKKGKFEQKFYGHHGGLTKEEVEIPLILLNSI